MRRLIYEDELIERIEDVLSRREHRQVEVPSWLQKIIDELPTGYDVDKVMEELKEWSFEAEIVIPGSDSYDDTANREIICTSNAIDIVRKGSVE